MVRVEQLINEIVAASDAAYSAYKAPVEIKALTRLVIGALRSPQPAVDEVLLDAIGLLMVSAIRRISEEPANARVLLTYAERLQELRVQHR